MKKPLLLILISVILFTSACQKEEAPAKLNPAVEDYLSSIMTIMETHSINRKTIDWTAFKKSVLASAEGAQDVADTKTSIAIQMALIQLQDTHSVFITAKGTYIGTSGGLNCNNAVPIIPASDKEIGYVKVGTFSGTAAEAVNFAQAIQDAIKAADSELLKGWIVDLRGNKGGNMWPMLGGVGPILGNGVAGYFINPDNVSQEWGYNNGVTAGFQQSNPYSLKKPNPRVAVLIDEATASSGEAIAIAFKTRADTKFFGMATCGLSTANQSFNMADGGVLYLTVSTMADRTKKMYGKRVEPDVANVDQQRYLNDVMAWLKQ